jgi:hypothetical protein
MNWFLALTADSHSLIQYAELLRVAVASARRHAPALRPHLLFDGELPDSLGWLASAGVELIPRRSFLHPHLKELAERTGNHGILAVGGGAYLRLEVPALALERGWHDPFALYTDLDVQFVADPLPALRKLSPRYFAAARENRADRVSLNTGVMLMNLPALRREDAAFRRFALRHLELCTRRTWDQEAYRLYYSAEWVPRLLRPVRWDPLPPELNWRPYWGPNPTASVIHFHGPKPQQAPFFRLPAEQRPPALAGIAPLATDYYFELAERWKAELAGEV